MENNITTKHLNQNKGQGNEIYISYIQERYKFKIKVMKKLIAIFSVGMLLVSCNNTTGSQNIEMIQKKYPKGIVYMIDESRYIVVDSINVLDIRIKNNGDIKSTVKIK